MTSYLRPDEEAANYRVRKAENKRDIVKVGTSALTGAAIASRVMPWLSEYIPTDLAVKGISKVMPKLGQFLDNGIKMGLDVKEGIEYIKSNIPGNQSSSKNIIEQYSPELHQFISEHVKNGLPALQAADLALIDKEKKGFTEAIKKIVKENKVPWHTLVKDIYEELSGGQQQSSDQIPPQQQIQQQPSSQNNGIDPGLAQLIQQGSALIQKFRGQ